MHTLRERRRSQRVRPYLFALEHRRAAQNAAFRRFCSEVVR
ncbi:hypothetical protein NORO109296_15235 [Nocardiopsis rhodophaea]